MRCDDVPKRGVPIGGSAAVWFSCVLLTRRCAVLVLLRCRISYVVRSGDVTHMHGDCQERFQHSIKVERDAADATERVSLVYKKRLSSEE